MVKDNRQSIGYSTGYSEYSRYSWIQQIQRRYSADTADTDTQNMIGHNVYDDIELNTHLLSHVQASPTNFMKKFV